MAHHIKLTQTIFQTDEKGNILHRQGEPLIKKVHTIYDGPLDLLEQQAQITELLRQKKKREKKTG